MLNLGLFNKRYLAAGEYTIADMISYPWASSWATRKIDIDEFPNVKARSRNRARPAVKKAMAMGPEFREDRPLSHEEPGSPPGTGRGRAGPGDPRRLDTSVAGVGVRLASIVGSHGLNLKQLKPRGSLPTNGGSGSTSRPAIAWSICSAGRTDQHAHHGARAGSTTIS